MDMRFISIISLATLLSACSPVGFSTVTTNGTAVAPNAVPAPVTACNVETIYRKTKILFLVDTSGSNANPTYNLVGNQAVLTPPTDPNKSFRGGAINQFFTTYEHKSNFNWGFATFSAGEAYAYINSGTYQSPVFANSPATMSNAINRFYTQYDEGDTPYASAIRLAANAVANDVDLNSADQPKYFIILLSDGFPTDYVDGSGNFLAGQMRADVSDLLAKAPGRVSLSTIFYGTTNLPTAVSALQQIASAGSGQFASVNVSNTSFKIEDIVSSNVCSK